MSPPAPDAPQTEAPQDLAAAYATTAQRAAALLNEHLLRQLQQGLRPPGDDLGVMQAFAQMGSRLLSNPQTLFKAQLGFAQSYVSLWQNSLLRMMGLPVEPLVTPARGDKRFKDEQWQEHFLFDFIKQSYLLTARHIHDTVSSVDGLDEQTQKKIDFFTRQYVDALSPSNFALTNPEVLRETLSSQGQNLLRGFNNLLRDIEQGDGELRIRMTDTEAFELGRNVATTPGKVIFQNELMQLLQYAPSTKTVLKRPLLIVPPWINKYYILDLREKNSFIKWCVDQGHTVFVISWVNPDEEQAQLGFDAYLEHGILAALDAVTQQTGEKQINAVGYCLGGTLLATALAWLSAKRRKPIASATFLTTLTDFAEPGELGVFIDEQQVSHLEQRMNERGYLEGSEMALTFNMLRANDLIWSFVVNNYLLGKDPFPFDLLYWNSDSTRLPAKMHSFYLRNMYLKNCLIEPGGIELQGVKIDLSKIRTPSCFISTIDDHIAPWKSTYSGARYFGGPVRFVLGGSGHIAGIVNPPAANKYSYWISADDTLPELADDWFASASAQPGSWWEDWQRWILSENADTVAPREPSAGPLAPLEDAPGQYVKQRLDRAAPTRPA